MGRLLLVLRVLAVALFTPGRIGSEEECFWIRQTQHSLQAVYYGTRDVAMSGAVCLSWQTLTSSKHNYSSQDLGQDIEEAKNYCRDPSGFGIPWCFVDTNVVDTEICAVPYCTVKGNNNSLLYCYVVNEHSQPRRALYQGLETRSKSGKSCRPWVEVKGRELFDSMATVQGLGLLETQGAFCRDMLGWGYPWCFTLPDGQGAEICDVDRCSGSFTSPPNFNDLDREAHRRWSERRLALLQEVKVEKWPYPVPPSPPPQLTPKVIPPQTTRSPPLKSISDPDPSTSSPEESETSGCCAEDSAMGMGGRSLISALMFIWLAADAFDGGGALL